MVWQQQQFSGLCLHLRSTFLIRPLFPLKAFFCDFYKGTKKNVEKKGEACKSWLSLSHSLFFFFRFPLSWDIVYYILQSAKVLPCLRSLLFFKAIYFNPTVDGIPLLLFLGPTEILQREKCKSLGNVIIIFNPPNSQCLKVTNNVSFELSKNIF